MQNYKKNFGVLGLFALTLGTPVHAAKASKKVSLTPQNQAFHQCTDAMTSAGRQLGYHEHKAFQKLNAHGQEMFVLGPISKAGAEPGFYLYTDHHLYFQDFRGAEKERIQTKHGQDELYFFAMLLPGGKLKPTPMSIYVHSDGLFQAHPYLIVSAYDTPEKIAEIKKLRKSNKFPLLEHRPVKSPADSVAALKAEIIEKIRIAEDLDFEELARNQASKKRAQNFDAVAAFTAASEGLANCLGIADKEINELVVKSQSNLQQAFERYKAAEASKEQQPLE